MLTRVRMIGRGGRRRTVWLEDCAGKRRELVKTAARVCMSIRTGIPADEWHVQHIETFHTPDECTCHGNG